MSRPPTGPTGQGRIRVRLVVRGRVQGVWFRGSARAEAQRRGLVGWAWNRSDGAVEVLAEGSAEKVEEFVEWCRRGPPSARVDSVARQGEAPGDDLVDFRIR